jgi:hypothetical protein
VSEDQIRRIGDDDEAAAPAAEVTAPAAAERGRDRSSSSTPLGRLVPKPESDLTEKMLMADLAANRGEVG